MNKWGACIKLTLPLHVRPTLYTCKIRYYYMMDEDSLYIESLNKCVCFQVFTCRATCTQILSGGQYSPRYWPVNHQSRANRGAALHVQRREP